MGNQQSGKNFAKMLSKKTIDKAIDGSIENVISNEFNDTLLSYKLTCGKLGIDLKLGDFAFMLLQFKVSVSSVHTFSGLVMGIFTFLKDVYKLSYMDSFEIFLNKVTQIVVKFFIHREVMRPQSGSGELDVSLLRDFVSTAKDAFKDFKSISESKFGRKFVTVMSFILTLPLVEKAGLDLSWTGYRKSALHLMKKDFSKQNKYSLWMYIGESCTFIVDRILDCIQYKSTKYMYIEEKELIEFDKAYVEVSYRCANLDSINSRACSFQLRDLAAKVEDMIKQCERFLMTYDKKHPLVKALEGKKMFLQNGKLKILDRMAAYSQRDPPYCFGLRGLPSAGKSDLADKIAHTCIAYENAITLPGDDHVICSEKYDDSKKYVYTGGKYMSGYSIANMVTIMDDVGQHTKEMTLAQEGGPLAKLIQMVNPTPFITPQAELQNKGNIPFLSKIVILTTNFEDFGMNDIFKTGGGAARRPIRIAVEVKPEYLDKDTGGIKGDSTDEYNFDLHYFKVSKIVNIGNKQAEKYWNFSTKKWVIISEYDGYIADYSDLSIFLKDEVIIPHYTKIRQMRRINARYSEFQCCSNCGYIKQFCSCNKSIDTITPQTSFGREASLFASKKLDKRVYSWIDIHPGGLPGAERMLEDEANDEHPEFYENLMKHYNCDYDFKRTIDDIHSEILPTPSWTDYLMYYGWGVSCLVVLPATYYVLPVYAGIFLSSVCTSRFFMYGNFIRNKIFDPKEAKQFFNSNHLLLRHKHQTYIKYGMMFISFVTIATFLSMFMSSKEEEEDEVEVVKSHKNKSIDVSKSNKSAFKPISVEHVPKVELFTKDVNNTDQAEPQSFIEAMQPFRGVCQNPWLVHYEPLEKLTSPMNNVTRDQLTRILERNVVMIFYKAENAKALRTNAFGIHGNLAVVNKHWFDKIESELPIKVNLIRTQHNSVCGPSRYDVVLDRSCFRFFNDDRDLVMMNLAQFGTFRDIRPFMINKMTQANTTGWSITRIKDGEIKTNPYNGIQAERVKYGALHDSNTFYETDVFKVFTYKPTEPGDCGGVYVGTGSNGYFILGVHSAIAQTSDGPLALVVPLIKEQFDVILPQCSCPIPSFAGVDLKEAYHSTVPLDILTPVHPKSPINALDHASAMVYGSIYTHRRKLKSDVVRTIMCEDILNHYGLDKPEFVSPKFVNERSSVLYNLEKMCTKTTVRPELIRKAVGSLTLMFIKTIQQHYPGFKVCQTDIDTAINGHDGIQYVDRIKMDTSGGFSHKGDKTNHMVELEPNEAHAVRYGMNDNISSEYHYIRNKILNDERPTVIWDLCHKDEPISLEKVKKQKTRLFSVSPLSFTILERQCFLWFVPLIMGPNRHHFGSALGADTTGPDWDVLYAHITQHGPDKCGDGDHSSYDKVMESSIILGAFEVLILIAEHFGATPEHIKLMWGIATECAYPQTNVFGSIMAMFGCNPSGHSLTTVINIIVNQMYMIIAATKIEETRENVLKIAPVIEYTNFYNHLALLCLGDDNLFNSKHDWLNHQSISKALGSMGIDYTMGDKTSKSVPFKHISKVTFLRRSFSQSKEENGVLAPLDEQSIIKSLTVTTKSQKISFEEQCARILCTAIEHYFHYGSIIFHEKRKFFVSLIHKYKLVGFVPGGQIVTYDDLYFRRFKQTIMKRFSNENKIEGVMPLFKKENNSINSTVLGLDSRLIERSDATSATKFVGVVELQSGTSDIRSEVVDATNDLEEVVEYHDHAPENLLSLNDSRLDTTYSSGQLSRARLMTFLMRPTEIFSETWQVNSILDFYKVFNPWELFLQDEAIRLKQFNFKVISGKLNLKFMINGAPFHYGRMFVGVRPSLFDNNTSTLGPQDGVLTTNYQDDSIPGLTTVRANRTLYTSRPHGFLNPTTNESLHITWPFFAASDSIDICDIEFQQRMGVIEMWDINKLLISNGAVAVNVDITVQAWMSDINMSGTTITEPAVTQSGESNEPLNINNKPKGGKSKSTKSAKAKEEVKLNKQKGKDEYADSGPISSVATTVAEFAQHLTSVPIIGKFAKATNITAMALADVSKLWGFSSTTNIKEIQRYKPLNYGELAVTDTQQPYSKLSLDSRNELSIDPQTVGLGSEDQMSFGYISKQESLIVTFPWKISAQKNEKILSVMVSPMVAPTSQTDGVVIRYMTPLRFLGSMFSHWRGSLRYRIQLVCSQFHRGRLLVTYDPQPDASFTGSKVPVNKRFSQIIDLAEEKDVTMEVQWGQPISFLETRELSTETVVTLGSVGTNVVDDTRRFNGRIEIFVLTALAAPVNDADIEVNVYVSGGDDLQFTGPTNLISETAFVRNDISVGPPIVPQSGMSNNMMTLKGDEPEQKDVLILNGEGCACPVPNQNLVYFGEHVASLRTMLKRDCYHRTLSPLASTTKMSISAFNIKNVPNMPGPSFGSSTASSITKITPDTDYNLCVLTNMRYCMQAYVGYRGSIRWKASYHSNSRGYGDIFVGRLADDSFSEAAGVFDFTSADTQSSGANTIASINGGKSSTHSGAAIVLTETNQGIEYEIPFYQPYRYGEVNEPFSAINPEYQVPYVGSNHFISTVSSNELTDNFQLLDMYTSAGEDFSLFFFIGCPPTLPSDVTSLTPA